jgi:hypothetical protein
LKYAFKFLNFRLLPIFDLGFYDRFFCPKPASLSRADAHPLDWQHLNCLPLWNWQPLLFLFASDTALPARFAYFDAYTDWRSLFVGPIATGFFFAAAKPWISLLMDKLGAQAIHRSRLHADRLAADRRSKQLEQQQNLAKEEVKSKTRLPIRSLKELKKLTKRSWTKAKKNRCNRS